MAIRLQDKPGVDPPSGNYPYGRPRNNSGSGDGFPVNDFTHGDYVQFFAKLLDGAGIEANGLPDNGLNGFQYYSALQSVINNSLVGLLDLKGEINANSNPNYPPANKGDSYLIDTATSVPGRIGGPAGKIVYDGDLVICKLDTAGGDEASVGNNWFVITGNSLVTSLKVDSTVYTDDRYNIAGNLDAFESGNIQTVTGSAPNAPDSDPDKAWIVICTRGLNKSPSQLAFQVAGPGIGRIYFRRVVVIDGWTAWTLINDPAA